VNRERGRNVDSGSGVSSVVWIGLFPAVLTHKTGRFNRQNHGRECGCTPGQAGAVSVVRRMEAEGGKPET
jgi:hypothetical protein